MSADAADLIGPGEVAFTLDLTAAQVAVHELPTEPQKATDKRGDCMDETVQAEALPPDVLAAVVDDALRQHIDTARLGALQDGNDAERAWLRERLRISETEEG